MLVERGMRGPFEIEYEGTLYQVTSRVITLATAAV